MIKNFQSGYNTIWTDHLNVLEYILRVINVDFDMGSSLKLNPMLSEHIYLSSIFM